MFHATESSQYRPIHYTDHGLTIKTLTSPGERDMAFQLRHQVFANELGWVTGDERGREADAYDHETVFFGVLEHGKRLLAFLRAHLPGKPCMLEKEFAFLVKGKNMGKDADSIEISRLCLDSQARSRVMATQFGNFYISIFLYKGIYQWCLKNKITHCFMVVEHKIFRLLRLRGFPCEQIGTPYKMPDGVMAVAAKFDWRRFEQINQQNKPSLFQWFSVSEEILNHTTVH